MPGMRVATKRKASVKSNDGREMIYKYNCHNSEYQNYLFKKL
jgi:hypothetical protein